jgi:hypothetical protein
VKQPLASDVAAAMHRRTLTTALALASLTSLAPPLAAQSVLPPFNAAWTFFDLGATGANDYFGTAFVPGAPNTLLVGTYGSGRIDALPLTRDVAGRIVGFGALTAVTTLGSGAPDGGLAFGPGNVLFFTEYPANRLGQLLPNSTTVNRTDDLTPLGVPGSVGACTFVPAGLPGAGRFKIGSWSGGTVHDVALTPDGNGTFAPTVGAGVPVASGPEGMVYALANAPLLGGQLLIAEWSTGELAAYQVDGIGNPLPATRQTVVNALSGPGGGAVDPLTGDIVFSDDRGHLLLLRATVVCGTWTQYGPASPGAGGTPTLLGLGCPRIGNTVTLAAHHVPNAVGVLALGELAINAPFGNVTVLQSLDVSVVHVLDGSGNWSLPLALPAFGGVGNRSWFFQVAYLDNTTSSGFAASAGLDMFVR